MVRAQAHVRREFGELGRLLGLHRFARTPASPPRLADRARRSCRAGSACRRDSPPSPPPPGVEKKRDILALRRPRGAARPAIDAGGPDGERRTCRRRPGRGGATASASALRREWALSGRVGLTRFGHGDRHKDQLRGLSCLPSRPIRSRANSGPCCLIFFRPQPAASPWPCAAIRRRTLNSQCIPLEGGHGRPHGADSNDARLSSAGGRFLADNNRICVFRRR